MTPEDRKKLQSEFKALDAAEAELDRAMAPFRSVHDAIDVVRQNLLEKHGVEIAGDCEHCDKMLFVGDNGYRYDDGPVLCEECAPTWADASKQWGSNDDNTEDHADFLQRMTAHIDAGGNPDDKLLFQL